MRFATVLAFVGGAASAAAVMSSEASREKARLLMMSALKQSIITGREVMRRAHEMNDDLQDLIAETTADADKTVPRTDATESSAKADRSSHGLRG